MARSNLNPSTLGQYRASRPSTVANAARIRSRFLNRLGIEKEMPPHMLKQVEIACSEAKSPPKPVIDNDQVLHEVLKDDFGRRDFLLEAKRQLLDSTSPVTTSPGKEFMPKRKRSVSFDSSVQVLPIPSRCDYSDRIRSSIWPVGNELEESIARNRLEYAAEGWDWRYVFDEEDMIQLSNGELVHPIHWMNEDCNLTNWNFCAFRAMHQIS